MRWSSGKQLKCHSLVSISRRGLFPLDFQVRKDDDTTKVCQRCFDRINLFLRFRESTAARNINYLLRKIHLSIERPTDVVVDNAIDQPNSIHEIFSDEDKSSCSDSDSGGRNPSCDQTAPIMCITVTDTESEDGQIIDDSQQIGPHTGNDRRLGKFAFNSIEQGIIRSFECYLCKKMLPNRRSLQAHKNVIHSRTMKIECLFSDCPRHFVKISSLQKHIQRHHQLANSDVKNEINTVQFSVKCGRGACKNLFESDGARMYHISTYHQRGIEKTYECIVCKSTMNFFSNLKTHVNKYHSHQTSFKCPFPECARVFDHTATILFHIRCHHVRKAVSSAN